MKSKLAAVIGAGAILAVIVIVVLISQGGSPDNTDLSKEPVIEADTIFTRVDQVWEPGKSFMGGTFGAAPEPAQRVLRAIDIRTGRVAWELPQFCAVERLTHTLPQQPCPAAQQLPAQATCPFPHIRQSLPAALQPLAH